MEEYCHKIEMHAHTAQASPCGQLPGAVLIQKYAEAGYEGVVITDHFRYGYTIFPQNDPDTQLDKLLSGYEDAKSMGDKLGIKVYMGAEMYFEDTQMLEFLLYGADRSFLRESLLYVNGTLERFYEFAHKNNVLVFVAHPFRYTDCPPDPAFIDGAETYNLHPGQNSRNALGLEYALQNNLPQVSGSDAHELHHVARGGILTKYVPEDTAGLRDLLKSGDYQLITEA